MRIYSNIVPETKVREVQRETLSIIHDALCKSFGPKGSSTAFVKNNDPNGANITIEHTKDGHTIIKNIMFQNPIERSVQDMLTDLTRYVVKEVGDGTTSAIILSKTTFDSLCDNANLENTNPTDITAGINAVVSEISTRIMNRARECTIDDIYDIALISTNNNEEIAGTIREVYKTFGMDVYIDVGISTSVDNIIKQYDGMTLQTGYTDTCFINNKTKGVAQIKNASIYCFNDPIDTPEMTKWVECIINRNIVNPVRTNTDVIPTVIFCKAISPDTESYFEKIVMLMNQYAASGNNLPLLIVSDIHQDYLFEDIAKMAGAPFIKKYLNPDIQKADQEAGIAPTPETIHNFCGFAEMVESDESKTKVIRPEKMYNEDGSYSDEYNAMLAYLKGQIDKLKQEDAGIEAVARAKRRYNSFKCNMVDFLIGGITISDRNNLKAAVEDAVLNCRSAAVNGVGYGANFMAYSVLNEMRNEEQYMYNPYVDILYNAYYELLKTLYGKSYTTDEVDDILQTSIIIGRPMNIRTNSYDGKVLSSIRSDIIILETINKILSLMYTTNQYLVQTPIHNIYIED